MAIDIIGLIRTAQYRILENLYKLIVSCMMVTFHQQFVSFFKGFFVSDNDQKSETIVGVLGKY